MITESGNALAQEATPKRSVSFGAHLHKRAAIITRWLHVYLSMVSFAVVLFFAVTGLTLNHPGWFQNQQRTAVRHGVMEMALLRSAASGDLNQLALVELLRTREHMRGAVSDVRIDDAQVQVSARAPGYTADVFIDRATGKYDITEVSSGIVAVMNDLHKGRDAGSAWAALIDASAILLTLVSVTGLTLIWFVYRRRTAGLLLALAGTAAVVLFYRFFVP